MTRLSVVLLLMLAVVQFCRAADFDAAASAYRERNYTSAFTAFTELANAGDARAQSVLAIMYKYGEAVPLDLAMAFHWYLQAAEQGYPPAQFHVGSMLVAGEGTTEDRELGITWLEKAAANGYHRATDLLTTLKGRTATILEKEPVAWSQKWNLRLPNQIRELNNSPLDSQLKVYRIQLGAMSTTAGAERLWHQLSSRHADLLGQFQPVFRQGDSAGKNIVRLQIGPFDDKPHATDFCRTYQDITRQAGSCVVLFTD